MLGLKLNHFSKRGHRYDCYNTEREFACITNIQILQLWYHHVSRLYCAWINDYIIQKVSRYPDSKVHRANMGPTLVLLAPDGPHVGPMNLAIWVIIGPCPDFNGSFTKLPQKLWILPATDIPSIYNHVYYHITAKLWSSPSMRDTEKFINYK